MKTSVYAHLDLFLNQWAIGVWTGFCPIMDLFAFRSKTDQSKSSWVILLALPVAKEKEEAEEEEKHISAVETTKEDHRRQKWEATNNRN